MRIFWFSLGITSLALGVVGAFLPLLPTVPFLLLAAFGFARSSETVHDWLIDHPRLGPPIQDWRANGAIRRRVKWLASVSILAAFVLSLALGVAPWVLGVQALVLICVSVFIWTRPEGDKV
jgi:uncharacterized membrane protein YbaN (DUF454 family)